jgi:hypothetical protein
MEKKIQTELSSKKNLEAGKAMKFCLLYDVDSHTLYQDIYYYRPCFIHKRITSFLIKTMLMCLFHVINLIINLFYLSYSHYQYVRFEFFCICMSNLPSLADMV